MFSRNFTMIKWSALACFFALIGTGTLRAQAGPQQGGNELQIWTGGGHGTNGSQSGDGVFNIGARYGWILTDAHGPGFLRGRFEYAVDVVPLFSCYANFEYGIRVRCQPICAEMEFRCAWKRSALRGYRRRNTFYKCESSGGYITRQFHYQRRSRGSLFARQI